MPVTALDPDTALIVIDLQQGVVAMPVAPPIGAVVARAAALATAFRRHGLPVALINVDGRPEGRTEQGVSVRDFPAGWTELIPELDRQPTDLVATKRTAGAFTSTDLEAQLRRRGVTQVVIVGVSTSMGVEATARHAFELGFNVTLAVDAMADMNPAVHANSIANIFPKLGETGTSQEVIALLDQRRAA